MMQKIIWASILTIPYESSVFVMMDVPDPEFMQTFGLRPDIKKAIVRTLELMFHLPL